MLKTEIRNLNIGEESINKETPGILWINNYTEVHTEEHNQSDNDEMNMITNMILCNVVLSQNTFFIIRWSRNMYMRGQ